MPPTTIHAAPALDTFTTLADHQSQTPTSFYGANPVLHYHATGIRAMAAQEHVSKLPIFTTTESQSTTGEAAGSEGGLKIENVDAFVSSEYLPSFPSHYHLSDLLHRVPVTNWGNPQKFHLIQRHQLHGPLDPLPRYLTPCHSATSRSSRLFTTSTRALHAA
jgi:hypothetical protein